MIFGKLSEDVRMDLFIVAALPGVINRAGPGGIAHDIAVDAIKIADTVIALTRPKGDPFKKEEKHGETKKTSG